MLTDFIARKMKEVQNLYSDIFGSKEFQAFLQTHIDFSFGAWEKDLNKIIDEKCACKLGVTIIKNEKIIVVVQYLIQQNKIKLYKSFINVWKKYDAALATRFEEMIKWKIDEKGLLSIDKEFDESEGKKKIL